MKLLYSNLPKSIETSDADPMEVDETENKWLPDFVEMVLCISEKASSRMKSRSAVTYGTRTLPFDINAYAEVCKILKSELNSKIDPLKLNLDAVVFTAVSGKQCVADAIVRTP